MTDEKFKALAEIVLVNGALLNGLVDNYRTLTEKVMSLLPEDPEMLTIIHCLEQLEALGESAKEANRQTREYFGLPPETENPASDGEV